MILLGIQVGLFIAGLIVLVSGNFRLSKRRALRGAAARWIGFVFLLPLSLGFCAGLSYGLLLAADAKKFDPVQSQPLLAVAELCIVGFCLLVAAAIAWCAPAEEEKRPPMAIPVGDEPLDVLPAGPDDRLQALPGTLAPPTIPLAVPAGVPLSRVRKGSWYLYLPAVVALGIPVVALLIQSPLLAGAGLVVAGVCCLIAVVHRWPVPLRMVLAILVVGFGYLMVLVTPVVPRAVAWLAKGRPITGRSTGRFQPPPVVWQKQPDPNPIAPNRADPVPPKPELPAKPESAFVGNIGPYRGIAVDPAKRVAFLTMRSPYVQMLSYPDFRLQGTYRLRDAAYEMVLDGSRGLLWVAATGNPDKEDQGLPAEDSLQAYDVKALLEGKRPAKGNRLEPLSVIPVPGHVSALQRSPDGKRLYLLLSEANANTWLVCVDADKRKMIAKVAQEPFTRCLCLTSDGKARIHGDDEPDAARILAPGI